jgi:hypothetical protein
MLFCIGFPSEFLGFLLLSTFISLMLTQFWKNNDSTHTNLFVNKALLESARVREVINIRKNKIHVIDAQLLGKVFISQNDLNRRIRESA